MFYFNGSDDPSVDIRPVLMRQIIKHDITIKEVRFIIANKNAELMEPCIYFPNDEVGYRYDNLISDTYCTSINEEERSKKFTCLTDEDRPFCKLFSGSLWYHGLTEYGHFGYDNKQPAIEPVGLDKEIAEVRHLAEHWAGAATLMDMFDLQTPLQPQTLDPEELYQDAYWSFVMESNFNKRKLSLTHRTFAPIMNLQPFVIVGAPGSLQLLRDLGYQTFGNYINEEYDSVKNNEERLLLAFRLSYQLAILTHDDHMTMMENITPILKHNQAHFLASKKHRCLDVLRKIR